MFVAIVALTFSSAFAQQNVLDSLEIEHSRLAPGAKKAQVLSLIAKETAESNPDSALYYAKASRAIIGSLELDSLKGALYVIYSTVHSYKAEYDSSFQYAFKALNHGVQYGNDVVRYDAYANLGIDFLYQEDYKKSEEYFSKAKKVADSLNSPYRLAHALNNLGLIAYYLGDSEKELTHYEEALTTFEKIQDQEGIGNTLLNIGTWHTDNEKFDQAKALYQQALKIFDEIGYKSAYGHTLESMAENYALAGEYNTALATAEEALKLFIENENKQDEAYCYEILEDIYLKQGNHRMAYHFQEKYYDLFETIYNEEKAELVENLHLKYETAKKQAAIAELKLSNEIKEKEIEVTRTQLYFLVGTLVCLSVVAGIFIYLMRRKQQAEQKVQSLQYEVLLKRYVELLEGPQTIRLDHSRDELNKVLHNPLTEREFEILQSSLEGLTNQQIADKLFVSLSTVKFHLGNVYNKFGVNNKKEALEYVVKTS